MATQDSEAEQEQHDSISAEVESMRRIAKALDALRDDVTRQRVLQWATDRYHSTAVVVAPQPVPVTQTDTGDPTLAIGELGDLFQEVAEPIAAAVPAPPTPKREPGVESMLKDFAADFRRFALEWQGA